MFTRGKLYRYGAYTYSWLLTFANFQCGIGAPGPNYDIGWSGLERSYAGCDFEKISITRGTLITGYVEAVIGLKDKAIHLQPDSYAAQIRWIAKKYVTLYDVTDRRAWLVDGASALLHLVRASLKDNETDDSKDLFLLSPNAIVEAPRIHTGKAAAIAVLNNASNKNLKLYSTTDDGDTGVSEDKGAYIRFQDRVDQIYHVLEQIFAHQVQVNVEVMNGFRGDTSRGQLEGFDFMDIATDEDQFWSHIRVLQPQNVGWVDLTRSVHAITLFGRGFGELIKPADGYQVCPSWIEVPKGRELLTTCVSHVNDILRKRGNIDVRPWQLVEGAYWHVNDKVFEHCQCANTNPSTHCDRIQILLSTAHLNRWGKTITSPDRLEPHGGVIFGPGLEFLPCQDDADANEATREESPSPERSENPSVDSGIGPSLGSSSHSRDSIDVTEKRRRLSTSKCALVSYQYASSHTSELSSMGQTRPSLFKDDPFSSHSRFMTDRFPTKTKGLSVIEKDSPPEGRAIPTLTSTLNPLSHVSNSMDIPPPETEYGVGWICALKAELDAALKMFDEYYGRWFGYGPDNNIYNLGRIGNHKVVLCCLPMGKYGNSTAAMVATRMMNKFANIKIGLIVGIGGGIPNEEDDIRLGDVVVSKPSGTHGGVIQYDLGRVTADGFTCTGSLDAPPEKLLAVLNMMPSHGSALGKHPQIQYPGDEFDRLYDPTYKHVGGGSCKSCDAGRQIRRVCGKRDLGPRIFYGTIASGNAVIRNADVRDKLRKIHGVLCFEMEAAGLMNSHFPCVVIRGISDYADSHKNDRWVEYAASTAAQYSKDFLCTIPGTL